MASDVMEASLTMSSEGSGLFLTVKLALITDVAPVEVSMTALRV